MDPRLPLLWSSIVTSELLLAGVAVWLGPQGPPDPYLWLGLIVVAAGSASLSIGWGRWFATDTPPLQRWLVRWATAEGIGVLGLVCALLGSPRIAAMGLFAASIGLTVAQYPREGA